jgi:hypothetical protein
MKKFIFILSFIILATINANAQYATEYQSLSGRTYVFNQPVSTSDKVAMGKINTLIGSFEKADYEFERNKKMFWITFGGTLLSSTVTGLMSAGVVQGNEDLLPFCYVGAAATGIFAICASVNAWKWAVSAHDKQYALITLGANGISVIF